MAAEAQYTKGRAQAALRQAKRDLHDASERAQKNAVNRDRAKSKRLAEQYGITIEKETFSSWGGPSWWVMPPKGLYENEMHDRFDGSHCCCGWGEILEICETYAKAVEEKAK